MTQSIPTFSSDSAAMNYWSSEARAIALPGTLDTFDAIKLFREGTADILMYGQPTGWSAYALRPQYHHCREHVRELTKRVRKTLLDRTLA